jgi:hypothetical protein
MTSCEKNLNKNKYAFNIENCLLTPIFNNQPKKLNNFSNLKNENKGNFPDIIPKYNKITPVIHNKQNINNSQGIYNITEISKTYSSSKPKNENKLMNPKYKLSKVVSNDFSHRINKSKILEIYNAKNLSKNSQLNSFKVEPNSTFDNLNKKNLKILCDSNMINNSINELRNLNIKKNSQDYNNLFNDNSSNNSNLATKRETIGNLYMKTDIKDECLNTPKDINYENKIIMESKNSNILGTPEGIYRKNNKIILANTTPENKIKITLEKNNRKILNKIENSTNNNRNNIITIKPSKNEHIILESIGNTKTYNSKTIKNKYTIDSNNANKDLKLNTKNKLYKCPEELHFYYITALQEGKKNEIEFEGE